MNKRESELYTRLRDTASEIAEEPDCAIPQQLRDGLVALLQAANADDQAKKAIPAEMAIFDDAKVAELMDLHEAIAEVAWLAKSRGYRPADSFDFHANVIAWALEFERSYQTKVAAEEWPEDEWIERIEDYVLDKLKDVEGDCENLHNPVMNGARARA